MAIVFACEPRWAAQKLFPEVRASLANFGFVTSEFEYLAALLAVVPNTVTVGYW